MSKNTTSKYIIKSSKWYGRFWPPERKKIKVMQAILDHRTPEMEKKIEKAWKDYIIYGKDPLDI